MNTSIEDPSAFVKDRIGKVPDRELVQTMCDRFNVTPAEARAIVSALRREMAERRNADNIERVSKRVDDLTARVEELERG